MLKEVEAERTLNELGYLKITCDHCRGLGTQIFPNPLGGMLLPKCWTCRGDGKVWKKKEEKRCPNVQQLLVNPSINLQCLLLEGHEGDCHFEQVGRL